MAHVAEVEVAKDGTVHVRRVVYALGLGIPVNADTIEAQVQRAVMFGISAALYGNITLKDGRVQQSNFHDYRALRINEAPAVEFHLVKSTEAPGGLGEAGTSAVAPAVVNAMYAATGTRLRKMPVDSSALVQAR